MFAPNNPEGFPSQHSTEEQNELPEDESHTPLSESVGVVEMLAENPEIAVKVFAQKYDSKEIESKVREELINPIKKKIKTLEDNGGTASNNPELREARHTKTRLEQALKKHLEAYS